MLVGAAARRRPIFRFGGGAERVRPLVLIRPDAREPEQMFATHVAGGALNVSIAGGRRCFVLWLAASAGKALLASNLLSWVPAFAGRALRVVACRQSLA